MNLKEYAKQQARKVESVDYDTLEQLVIDSANWQKEQKPVSTKCCDNFTLDTNKHSDMYLDTDSGGTYTDVYID